MTEWVNCTGINGASILVNLENVLTITNYGTGTRLALSGNSQTYVDVAEAPAEVLALPRMGREIGKDFNPTSSRSHQETNLSHAPSL
jgi:hypothetical protein